MGLSGRALEMGPDLGKRVLDHIIDIDCGVVPQAPRDDAAKLRRVATVEFAEQYVGASGILGAPFGIELRELREELGVAHVPWRVTTNGHRGLLRVRG